MLPSMNKDKIFMREKNHRFGKNSCTSITKEEENAQALVP